MRKARALFFAAGLALTPAAPLLAQAGTDGEPAAASSAASQQLAEKLLPPGTYEKLMGDQMSQMTSKMIKSMFDTMPDMLVAMAGPEGSEERAKAENELSGEFGDRSFDEIMTEYDPHFFERMEITQRVLMSEMGKLFSDIEPQMRIALGEVVDERYTQQQVAEALEFYNTRTGDKLAGDLYSLFMDEKVVEVMMEAMPSVMQAMPAMMEKVEAATAHLPPADPCERDPNSDLCAQEASMMEVAEDEPAEYPAYWNEDDVARVEALLNEAEAAYSQYDAAYSRYDELYDQIDAEAAGRTE